MDPKYIQALQILIIGMGTVFVILFLVVQLSKILISTVNTLSKKEARHEAPSGIPTPHLVAVVAGVDHTTEGRGTITRITKIEKE